MNIQKLYYGLVSLVSLVVIAVSTGSIIYNVGKYYLISTDEYLASYKYEFNSCSYETKARLCGSNIVNCKYDVERYNTLYSKCLQERKTQILLQRSYNLKISLLKSFSSLIIFLILFLFHYPKFKQLSNENLKTD